MSGRRLSAEVELRRRARSHIRRKTVLVYDVCACVGQILDNVSHMRWLENAVMDELRKEP